MSQEIAYARDVTRESVIEVLKKPFRDGSFVGEFVADGLLGVRAAPTSSAI